jgi:hypothetical protein
MLANVAELGAGRMLLLISVSAILSCPQRFAYGTLGQCHSPLAK